jgi:DNA-binding beta-propeller fold protein YncE
MGMSALIVVLGALSDIVANVQGESDGIAVIDIPTRRVVAQFDSASDPEQFAASPDRRRLLVSNEDADTASITRVRADASSRPWPLASSRKGSPSVLTAAGWM